MKWIKTLKIKIQGFLVQFPRLNCLQRVLRHLHDKSYVNDILNMQEGNIKYLHWTDPQCIYIEKLGKRNPNDFIYLFKEVEAIGGFFAQHRRVLLALSFAERHNMKPVVYFGKDYKYHENTLINGTENGFEYYFQPVSDITYEDALVSNKVVFFAPCHLRIHSSKEFSFYNPSEDEIRISAEMQKKYIKLQPNLEKRIFTDINKLLNGKKTIGIHVRGTDFRLGLKNHPIPIDIMEHFKNVHTAFEKYGFEQVFVATDEIDTINAVKNEFGHRAIFYNDVFRSDEETAVQYKKCERKLHNYLMGVEVLRDMLTLASCDGLTAGLSQVSICAQITKLSWDKTYEYYKIMNNGLFEKDSEKAKNVVKTYIRDGRIPTNF